MYIYVPFHEHPTISNEKSKEQTFYFYLRNESQENIKKGLKEIGGSKTISQFKGHKNFILTFYSQILTNFYPLTCI